MCCENALSKTVGGSGDITQRKNAYLAAAPDARPRAGAIHARVRRQQNGAMQRRPRGLRRVRRHDRVVPPGGVGCVCAREIKKKAFIHIDVDEYMKVSVCDSN